MPSSRRDFLSTSAAAAAAVTLGPLGRELAAEPVAEARVATTDVKAFEERMLRAHPVPLNKVRVLGGPLKTAQDAHREISARARTRSHDGVLSRARGLAQKAEPYGGWDGGGRNLTGHIAGHHLSAVSLMYHATGDARFKARADYLVQRVQGSAGQARRRISRARSRTAARPSARCRKGDIRSGGFDLNGLWSPWYMLHKTYAGLRDAYRHTGNRTALDVEIKFATWAERRLAPLTTSRCRRCSTPNTAA